MYLMRQKCKKSTEKSEDVKFVPGVDMTGDSSRKNGLGIIIKIK